MTFLFPMDSSLLFLFVFILFACGNVSAVDDVPFEQNYEKLWGLDHIKLLNQDREVQLSLDQTTGCGIHSLKQYGSGFFSMRIQTPPKDTTNIITTFYLNSTIDGIRDEMDFELIYKNNQHILHTNLVIMGQACREQEILLWFNPSSEFHNYSLLWNQHQIVWFVDDTPVRVFKNSTNIGGRYPTQPAKIVASIWSDPDWPSPGKQIQWGDAPFVANYQGFGIEDCPTQSISSDPQCYFSNYWWNQEKYWQLDPTQRQNYDEVRRRFLTYDYCSKQPSNPECQN